MRHRTDQATLVAGLIASFAIANAWAAQEALLSAPQACSLLKKRMGIRDGVPPSDLEKVWSCDVMPDDRSKHSDWWVIGLRSFRQCDG